KETTYGNCGVWSLLSKFLTFLVPSCCLSKCGKLHESGMQQAWREKASLCMLIFCGCLALAFLQFGLSIFVCRPRTLAYHYSDVRKKTSGKERWFIIRGRIFNLPVKYKPYVHKKTSYDPYEAFAGGDISPFFRPEVSDACVSAGFDSTGLKCSLKGLDVQHCHSIDDVAGDYVGTVTWSWKEIDNSKYLLVYNGYVLNIRTYLEQITPGPNSPKPYGNVVDKIFRESIGGDATKAFTALSKDAAKCLINDFGDGIIEGKSVGCILTDVILYMSLIAILAVILIKFFLAVTWSCCLSNHDQPLYSILVVTCYSEEESGLRTTIESLVETDVPDAHKLLFIVADGLVTGSGNDRSTPQILVDMLEIDQKAGWLPEAFSYVAIADGEKRHNMARIFAGHYSSNGHKVPAVVVVKCGTPAEALNPKPGNRGKRDSQILLMSFLSKVLFGDRMTPLEYDLYRKIRHLTNVTADQFEAALCVDADTKVKPDALRHMLSVLRMDSTVMGLCGETRIANKNASWVTVIQVFEYFISHHLNKSFESVFGGVTCLPGCFCLYRIKAPKGPMGCYVPILASPDIVDAYSENITDTLHKKNLLLLGEDRYLTTLMLKTFPKRKLLFVPSAKCKTQVPDSFKVLLSQRRRWINSTVHNLFELVLVNDLCGTFCCSMQFIIFMELLGTLVLPAAILFTGVMIVTSIIGDLQIIPLGLLAAILGLPAFLIFLTRASVLYAWYMFCYLLSLPVWNFILPVYAYWHFDDFSWGETRKIESTLKEKGHGDKEGVFDHSQIVMKKLEEYE
ncbi:unnamed protein product, partial [Sphagnum compactum]